MPVCVDLTPTNWPFSARRFGAIVCVHFLDMELLPQVCQSLADDGHLYIETFGGQGGNYLALPKEGELHARLADRFSLAFYQERTVGLPSSGACAVKLLARKVG
jgi:hypothetical protein